MIKDKNKSLKSNSKLESDKRVLDVMVEMFESVFENEVYTEPFITWISIGQLYWANGFHYNFPKKKNIMWKSGLLKHMGYKPASNNDRYRWYRRTGWYAPELPYKFERDVRTSIKRLIINPMIDGEKYHSLKPFYSQGFINPETLSYDSRYSNAVCGYFFILEDEQYLKTQTKYLEDLYLKKKFRHITLQYEFCKSAFERTLDNQIRSSESKIYWSNKLLESTYWKRIKLDSVIQEKHITWEREDFDD